MLSKPQKIKRKRNPFGRPRRPWKPILIILAVAALVFVGISLYRPIVNYITGNLKPKIESSDPISETSPPPVVSTPSQPDIPDDTQVVKAENISGIVLPYETAIDPQLTDSFLATLSPDTNTVVVEVKNHMGEILYKTDNEYVSAWSALSEDPIDLNLLASKLKEKNLSLAVILSVFSDPIAARGSLENAIMHSSGVIWIDNALDKGGKPWTTPYSSQTRDYNQQLAKELATIGADFIILDYVRFPNDPTNSAVLGRKDVVSATSKQDILKEFVTETGKTAGIPVYVLLSSDLLVDLDGSVNQSRFGGSPLAISDKRVILYSDISLGASYSQEITQMLQSKDTIIMQGNSSVNIPTDNKNYIENTATED